MSNYTKPDSFTRNIYDNNSTLSNYYEFDRQFNLVTQNGIKENDTNCNINDAPYMHNHFYNIPSKYIDLESELIGKKQLLSKCVSVPSKIQTEFTPECTTELHKKMNPLYSRIDHPASVADTIITDRFPPLDNIQQLNKIHSNSYIGVNTRLQIKDAFTTVNKPKTNFI